MLEVTDVGWLSLAALLAGLLFGGSVSPLGFTLSLDTGARSLYLTPVVEVRLRPEGPLADLYGLGMTLGGTVLTVDYPHVFYDPQLAPYRTPGFSAEGAMREMSRYEWGHVAGWNHYGIFYAAKAFAEPCRYDPRNAVGLAACGSLERTRGTLAPATGAFALRWSP